MTIKHTYLLLLLCLFLGFGEAFSQDLDKDLKESQMVLQNAKQAHIVMSIKAYEKQGSKWIDGGESKFELYKSKELVYYKVADMEVIKTEKTVLMVLNAKQQIIRRKLVKAKPVTEEITLPINLDSLLKSQAQPQVKFLGNKNGNKQYQINFGEQATLKEMRVEFSGKTRYIQSFEYLVFSEMHETDIKTEVKVVVLDTNTAVPNVYFAEQTYLSKVKGSWQATSKYKNYQVISLGDEKE